MQKNIHQKMYVVLSFDVYNFEVYTKKYLYDAIFTINKNNWNVPK